MDYQAELQATPAPGSGCHPHLLRVANLGAISGLAPDQVAADIRQAIPAGKRHVPDREIQLTVQKAFREKTDSKRLDNWQPFKAPVSRPRIDANALLAKIMAEGSPEEVDLWEASPVRLDGPPEDDAVLLLRHLYRPEEIIFLGDTYDRLVMTVDQWITWVGKCGTHKLPHIIQNPLDGSEHETSAGTLSYRCDAAVTAFRFALVEFDDIGREDQLRFWSGVLRRRLLNVVCLIDSGGKSVHGWVRVDVPDRAGWDRDVKQRLFDRWLIPLGADPTTRNPSRLSRLPGHKRANTGRWQRLLWLQQKGKLSYG